MSGGAAGITHCGAWTPATEVMRASDFLATRVVCNRLAGHRGAHESMGGWRWCDGAGTDVVRVRIVTAAPSVDHSMAIVPPPIALGDLVYLPNRLQAGHPGYESAVEIYGEPGPVVSIEDGWAMVDRGKWGQFGCPVRDLRPAGERR